LDTEDEVIGSLRRLGDHADEVTKRQRGIALALSVLCYLVTAPMWGAPVLGALGLLSAIASGAMLRGGLWLRACGVAVVDREGRDVSRLRASVRAALAWSWVPLTAVGVVIDSRALVGFATTVCVLALLDASLNPRRGVHDRLAGTYLVPS
jgi:hypothetical protein